MAKEATDTVRYQGMNWERDDIHSQRMRADDHRDRADQELKWAQQDDEIAEGLRKAFDELDESRRIPAVLIDRTGKVHEVRILGVSPSVISDGHIYTLIGAEREGDNIIKSYYHNQEKV